MTAPRSGAVALAALLVLGPALPAAADPEVGPADLERSVEAIDPDGSVEPIDLENSITPLESEEVRGGTTTVTVSADVLFEFDEAALTGNARQQLADIAERLRGATGTVEVVGHSDGLGEDSYNQDLSERRAEAVRDALLDELGADAPEIEASGRGSEEPVAEETDDQGNDDPAGRAQNRRVEIVFEGG
ncbi:OmpA family protein [Streptomonospora nanhaiensis]|uniref:OmpA family protein n=1 Tax=Streptomonospora nanhaiensis TaxID=1323731 RepID=UPI001C38D216|nr:OmpA family protein [Streptomonospora nanhaiensis]MBV2364334.1 OmpA family protein [Streptomonospora nanhaiensis]